MITTITLFFLAGMLNAVMDKLQFHYSHSIFSVLNAKFWNPAISWKNKYKNWPDDKREKFLGSTTIFVGLTDAWHLFQSLWILCFVAAPFLQPGAWWVSIIYFVTYTGSFTFFFHYILEKK